MIKTWNFPAGEVGIRIEDVLVADEYMVDLHTPNSDEILRMLFLVDAIRRMKPEVRLYLNVPYFPYARQDRVMQTGESHSLKVIADLINSCGFDSLGLSKVVFRPDSGDPVEIICGMEIQDYTEEATDLEEATECAKEYLVEQISEETPHGELGDSEPEDYFIFQGQAYLIKLDIFWNRHDKQYYYIDEVTVKTVQNVELTPQQKGSVQCLAESFGYAANEKGFKTICNRVGLIYGDSITPQRAEQILQRLANKGYAADNIVFGIGSYTFQYNTRDTLGFAMKATYVEVGNKSQAIFKEPKTDNGAKKSAKGLLRVNGFSGNYELVNNVSKADEQGGCLRTVYKDGTIVHRDNFADIRSRLGAM